jgi:hypothetical protein
MDRPIEKLKIRPSSLIEVSLRKRARVHISRVIIDFPGRVSRDVPPGAARDRYFNPSPVTVLILTRHRKRDDVPASRLYRLADFRKLVSLAGG